MHALSDPIRLCIVRTLDAKGELQCGTFCETAAKSTMSHHFKVLREAGLITMRPVGTSYLNSIRKRELEKRFPGLLKAVLRADGPL